MYLIFEKEQWEDFKSNTISKAIDEEKVFVQEFFDEAEKHGEWKELPE